MQYEDTPTREFKGIWIPAEIWEDETLTVNEKILYLEIDSFTSNDKSCFISNEHIAKLLHVSENAASKILNSLVKKRLIIVTKFDGRKRYIQSVARQTRQKAKADERKEQLSIGEKDTYYNQDNNTNNNKKENISSLSIPYDEIKDMWNRKCSMLTTVTTITSKRKEKIRARFKEFSFVGEPIDIFSTLLDKTSKSKWMTEESRENWRKGLFDWLFANSENWVKVWEGKYDSTSQQSLFEEKQKTIWQ